MFFSPLTKLQDGGWLNFMEHSHKFREFLTDCGDEVVSCGRQEYDHG